jgi:hypothetical protein
MQGGQLPAGARCGPGRRRTRGGVVVAAGSSAVFLLIVLLSSAAGVVQLYGADRSEPSSGSTGEPSVLAVVRWPLALWLLPAVLALAGVAMAQALVAAGLGRVPPAAYSTGSGGQ